MVDTSSLAGILAASKKATPVAPKTQQQVSAAIKAADKATPAKPLTAPLKPITVSGTLDAYANQLATQAAQAAAAAKAAGGNGSSTLDAYANQLAAQANAAKKEAMTSGTKSVLDYAAERASGMDTTLNDWQANANYVAPKPKTPTGPSPTPINRITSTGSTGGVGPTGSSGNNNNGGGSTTTPPVKIATSNLFIFDDSTMSVESMADLIFEDIGGHEIIGIARNDMTYALGGEIEPNQTIKNLADLSKTYNPQNILAIQDTADKIFGVYPLKFYEYVPLVSNQIDYSTNNLIISATGIDTNNKELIEVEVLTSGNVFDATIYEG